MKTQPKKNSPRRARSELFPRSSLFSAGAIPAIIFLCGCTVPNDDLETPIVIVSIAPHAFLVEQLAGDTVQCDILLRPTASPINYAPTPGQVLRLSRAQLFVRSHVPFEIATWDRLHEINPDIRIADASDHIVSIPMDEHDHHDHGFNDPHTWLDPKNMILQSEAVAAALIEIAPGDQPRIAANLAKLKTTLTDLDQEIRTLLAPHQGKEFWVYHPAWAYFARAYGLEQRTIELAGKQPSPRQLVRAVHDMTQHNVRTLFADPSFNDAPARVLASEIDAQLEYLDPLRQDYVANMKEAAQRIAKAAK